MKEFGFKLMKTVELGYNVMKAVEYFVSYEQVLFLPRNPVTRVNSKVIIGTTRYRRGVE
jgi:hypothetical protein